MASLTITSNSAALAVTSFRLPHDFNLTHGQKKANDLFRVLKKYSKCSDPLSKDIRNWAQTIFSVDLKQSSGKIKKQAEKCLNTLVQNVLVSSLDKCSLTSPMIDHSGLIWEASYLNEYLKYASISPCDGKPLTYKEHRFAKAMIQWKDSLGLIPKTAVAPTHAGAIVLADAGTTTTDVAVPFALLGAPIAMLLTADLAQSALETQQLKETQELLSETTKAFVDFKEEMEQAILLEAERAEEKALLHEAVTKQRITSIETAHQNSKKILEQRIETGERQLQTTQTLLNQTQMETSSLRSTLQSLNHSHQQMQNRIGEMERQISENRDSGSLCVIS